MNLPKPVDQAVELWERQPDETAKQYEGFVMYRDLRPNERSVRVASEKLGKQKRWCEQWATEHNWVQRAVAWDAECDRVARQARLDEIERINREDIRIADSLMTEVEHAIPGISGVLRTQPRALAEVLKVVTKMRRDAAGIAEPKADQKVTVAGDPENPLHHDIAGIFANLDPASVLKLRDVAIDVAQVKARETTGELPAVVNQAGDTSHTDVKDVHMQTTEGYPDAESPEDSLFKGSPHERRQHT